MLYGEGAIATTFHLHVVQQTTANHITSKEHRTSDRTTVGHDPGGSRSHDRGPILDPIRDTRIRVLGCWCLVGGWMNGVPVSYTHLRAHETKANLVCRLLLEKKKIHIYKTNECYKQ